MKIRPDDLAYWYLRLNGFLTTINFIVHPDVGGTQRTDVDILGVRFPFRAELLMNSMDDDPILTCLTSKPFIVIAEVKRGFCRLNGPWTRAKDENMERVVRSIGLVPIQEVDNIASSLYENGAWESGSFLLSLMCFGREENESVAERYPRVPQITWNLVIDFIFDRFQRYMRQKASHPQWDSNGCNLWDSFIESSDSNEMMEKIELAYGN